MLSPDAVRSVPNEDFFNLFEDSMSYYALRSDLSLQDGYNLDSKRKGKNKITNSLEKLLYLPLSGAVFRKLSVSTSGFKKYLPGAWYTAICPQKSMYGVL
ncbi:hypothetical protein P3L10_013382 [Capsicum annuum]